MTEKYKLTTYLFITWVQPEILQPDNLQYSCKEKYCIRSLFITDFCMNNKQKADIPAAF